jgi:hypothetical protein
MPRRSALPGLKRIVRDGKCTWWWVASQITRRAGAFRPKAVRLWQGAGQPPADELARIEHLTLRLYIELQEWLFAKERRAPSKRGQVYFVRVADKVKIGFTQHLSQRLTALQASSPFDLKLELAMEGSAIIERVLHARFKAQRINGEWFNYAGPIARFVEQEQMRTKGQNRRSESPADRSESRGHAAES